MEVCNRIGIAGWRGRQYIPAIVQSSDGRQLEILPQDVSEWTGLKFSAFQTYRTHIRKMQVAEGRLAEMELCGVLSGDDRGFYQILKQVLNPNVILQEPAVGDVNSAVGKGISYFSERY